MLFSISVHLFYTLFNTKLVCISHATSFYTSYGKLIATSYTKFASSFTYEDCSHIFFFLDRFLFSITLPCHNIRNSAFFNNEKNFIVTACSLKTIEICKFEKLQCHLRVTIKSFVFYNFILSLFFLNEFEDITKNCGDYFN